MSVAASGGRRWVTLEGDLDTHTSGAVSRCLEGLSEETAVTEVVIDLRALRRFDDAGVAVLLDAVDGPWPVRWQRPRNRAVGDALAETLVTDFFIAIDEALHRAATANKLAQEFEGGGDAPAPEPTKVVWVARRNDDAVA
jgi:anti-anti-sigma regulatory factor